jgi:hypothetical protein
MTLIEPTAELAALKASAPLPQGWDIAESLFEATEVPGLSVSLVGLFARAADGREALGSAGARCSAPVARAYFELFERVAVLEALAEPRARYAVRGLEGQADSLGFGEVFPEPPPSALFKYSRSNGVAAGPSWSAACASAAAELVERDRLLRTWYGEGQPIRVPLPEDEAFRALEPWYELEAYSFAGRATPGSELAVAAVFGFPKVAEAPLVFGSAAAPTLALALDGAERECLQRWGFLWGERIPSEAPSFAATADYHQELYLWPEMHAQLRRFLAGGHVGLATLKGSPRADAGPRRFVDLSLATGPAVARAVAEAELPLTFGRGHPFALGALPEPLSVHPIA